MRESIKSKLLNISFVRKSLFARIYRENKWEDAESRSGSGSNFLSTSEIRPWIPQILEKYSIQSVLDVPCGDRFWSKDVFNSFEYTGAEIVPALVRKLKNNAKPNERFVCLDALKSELPKCDLIFSRDFFIHLSNQHVELAISNFRRSGAKYLMASTYPGHENQDQNTGGFRPLNLEAFPFSLGKPLEIVSDLDISSNEYGDKSLALFKL